MENVMRNFKHMKLFNMVVDVHMF